MRVPSASWVGVALLALVAQPASAQPSSASTYTLGKATVDLAVPESPAFVALGLTPDQVSRPTSGRELATSLLNGVDRDGNLQTGLAIDAAPYMIVAGASITLEDYQAPKNYLVRFLARWQVSFASTKGGGADDPSTRLALGTRVTMFDRGDPRTDADLLKCLADTATRVLNGASPISPGLSPEDQSVELARREELVRAGVKPCREAAARRRWNRSAWVAGLAPTWTSPDGTAVQLDYSGTALWTSLGYGFEDVPVLENVAMLALHIKRRDREKVADQIAMTGFVTQDSFNVGARLMVGSSRTHANAEALWVRNDRVDGLEDRYWNLAVSYEQRLIDNMWLSLSLGRQVSRGPASNLSITSAFNWGLGER